MPINNNESIRPPEVAQFVFGEDNLSIDFGDLDVLNIQDDHDSTTQTIKVHVVDPLDADPAGTTSPAPIEQGDGAVVPSADKGFASTTMTGNEAANLGFACATTLKPSDTPEQQQVADTVVALWLVNDTKQKAYEQLKRTASKKATLLKENCDHAQSIWKKSLTDRRTLRKDLKNSRAEADAARNELAESLCKAHDVLGGVGRAGRFGPFIKQQGYKKRTVYTLMKAFRAKQAKKCAADSTGTLVEFTAGEMKKLIAVVGTKCSALKTDALVEEFVEQLERCLKDAIKEC